MGIKVIVIVSALIEDVLKNTGWYPVLLVFLYFHEWLWRTQSRLLQSPQSDQIVSSGVSETICWRSEEYNRPQYGQPFALVSSNNICKVDITISWVINK